MTDGVQLSPEDIRGQLRTLAARRGEDLRPVALHGTGIPGVLQVDGHEWTVRPVRSELDLRAALLEAEADPAVVLLVDWADQLPLDVACRLHRGRVYRVDARTRLANLFGAREVAPGFGATALAEVLLSESDAEYPPITGTRLQEDDAWRRYLHVRAGLPLDGGLSADRFLRWALDEAERGPAFARRRNDAAWAGLLREGGAWAGRVVGCDRVWRAWLDGTLPDLVGWTVHVQAVRRSGSTPATLALKMALRYAVHVDPDLLDEPLATVLVDAVDQVLRDLAPDRRDVLLHHARGLVDGEEFVEAHRASPWLREGLDALQEDLAQALQRSEADPSAMTDAFAVLDRIGAHHLVQDSDEGRSRHRVLVLGVQLANWLAWGAARGLPTAEGWASMGPLADWYARDGGYVDRARDELLTHADTGHAALDATLRGVLERADAVRRDLDHRFARSAVAWVEAEKPHNEAIPIERVFHEVAAPFLDDHPGRRLLIIVLDGMSVSVAHRLFEQREGWARVAWKPARRRRVPPAVACFPTLTQTSRAALFAGRAEARHGNEPTSRDSDRWRKNPAVDRFAESGELPPFFDKSTLGRGGELSDAVKAAVGRRDLRLVSVILNAIDDQLSGSDQVDVRYDRPDSIPFLSQLLDRAREAERAVLLVSDHGHVPGPRLTGRPLPAGAERGQRWRVLGPRDAAVDGEIELPASCWRPRGSSRIAALVDERWCWGQGQQGAHGGLSLSEAIIPVLLMAPHWLGHVSGDEGLDPLHDEPPAWWRLKPPPTKPASALGEPEEQLSLIPPVKVPRREEPPPEPEWHPVAAALAASGLFRGATRDVEAPLVQHALTAVDALARVRSGELSREAFARALGVPTRRVTGLIARMGFLNADGYTVLEHDAATGQVRLHLDRLKAQYGLS